ncbi:MAG: hypothetical protein NTZ87_02540 [Candidatus Nomurabacteria bacterium]|nr:hypothetical protein [Candidatus Nomurabacteria bacterium]
MFSLFKKKNKYQDLSKTVVAVGQFLIEDTGSDMPTPLKEFLDPKKLDFSLESLKLVDSYLDEVRKQEKDLSEDKLIKIVLRCGAYCGEVIRKNSKKNRYWINYDHAIVIDPLVKSFEKSVYTFYILFAEPRDFVFPLAKVGKYIENGSEDSLYFLAISILSSDNK